MSISTLPLLSLLLFTGCGRDNYEMKDFSKVPKIDAHVHLNTSSTAWIELAKEDNFKLLSINVDYSDFNPVEEQLAIAINHRKNFPDVFAFASTFHMKGWDNDEWVKNTIAYIDSTVKEGACAVKVWKNIGMEFRDKDSSLVMIDNPRFDAIFAHLRDINIPLIGHQGEPKDCWMPVKDMMINDMKLYFGNHPHYHMYKHPDMPSYQDQVAARDRMLSRNRETNFMGAHIGSLEWSLDELGKFFDKFPNARVDLSARMSYMELQAANNYNKTRSFFIKYQDRLIYATDNVEASGSDDNSFKQGMHDKWLADWKFLVTDSIMKGNDFEKKFKGLSLPKEVVNKIYRENALKLFTKAWK
jgi:predicted TIM-barrel fold metal-dependent hydrolase